MVVVVSDRADPTAQAGTTHADITDGLTIGYEPLEGGIVHLTTQYDGEILTRGEYPSVFDTDHAAKSQRGSFYSDLESAIETTNGLEMSDVKPALESWFQDMAELKDEDTIQFLPKVTQEIIDGTQYVEIHGGETTTWNVELSFAGRTNELEFTAAEMTGKGGAAELEQKIANQFYEIIEIEPEDWDEIRTRWNHAAEVVSVVEETSQDAVADRVLGKLTHGLKAVGNRADMGNDVAAAWYDRQNEVGYSDAPVDASIVWVQDDFLVDQLEAAGKQISYKSQLVKDLISRGDLYGSRTRRKGDPWPWESRTKLWPFHPDALGVGPDDVGGTSDPNHSEVQA